MALMASTALLEHLALGLGVQAVISYSAGGNSKWFVGLIAAGLVAGFKEGADAVAGTDPPIKAAFDALTIVLGAGALALIQFLLRKA